MNAIILVIDRLNLGYLGGYGNAWVGTPAFDRLACQSLVCDSALVDSLDLSSLYSSYWLGWHASAHAHRGRGVTDSFASLGSRLTGAGIHTHLVTDASEVAGHPLAVCFQERETVPTDWPRRARRTADETQAARFFSAALSTVVAAKPPYCLWLHWQGMAGPWDAPRAMREQYADEEDPSPPDFIAPPSLVLPDDPDPDVLLGLRQAYAAQTALFDECLEAFLAGLREQPASADTLLVVLSARGYPLGLHGIVGQGESDGVDERTSAGAEDTCDAAEPRTLFSECVHVPWLLQFPGGTAAADRSTALVQPADLFATLIGWFRPSDSLQSPQEESVHPAYGRSLLPLVKDQVAVLRDRAAIVGPAGELALRTPAWYARFAGDSSELFVKPDDRWDVNDVARRCPDVADGMRQALRNFSAACQDDSAPVLQPLSEELMQIWR